MLRTNCWFFNHPSVAKTDIFSGRCFDSLALSHSLKHTHTPLPLSYTTQLCFSSPTYCLDREKLLSEGYFTLRLWLIRGGVEVEDEAVEE